MKSAALDVCVLGGGPAGTSAALRLARLGYRVALIDRVKTTSAGWEESIAPSIAPLFDSLGLRQALSSALFSRPARKRLRWTEREEVAHEDGSLLVERHHFDRVLLDSVAGAGVRLFRPAIARRPAATPTGWTIPVDTESGRLCIEARFLIDARGRCGKGRQSGTPTVALCGTWRVDRVPDMPEMLVEAVADGWLWAATRLDGSVRVLAFVDTQVCAGLGRAGLERLYRAMAAGSTLVADFRPTELLGGVAVRDSTWRVADQIVTPRSIKVGDRAFAMDPLSSQGVQSALRSGIQAGAVVHTILSDGDVEAALQFCRQSHEAAIAHHRRAVAAAFAGQSRRRTPFWSRRSPETEPALEPPPPLAMPASDAILRFAADVGVVDAPVINGDAICRQPALMHPSLDRPVAWLGSAPIATIISAVRSRKTVAEVLAEYSGQPTLSSHAVLSWLLARGIVTVDD